MPHVLTALRLLLLTGLALLIGACQKQVEQHYVPQYTETQHDRTLYHFAVHPLYNPEMLSSIFNPLMHYLTERIPDATFVLESSRDYASFEEKIRRGSVEFLLPNPYQTLLGELHGYNVFAKMGDDNDFHGIMLVRRDSGITTPEQVKGRTVSYPSPTAIAATMMPQQLLHDHGIDINSDINNIYVGSQESSILAVYHRQSDVAATWPPPWRAFQKKYPREAAELQLMWHTPTLPNNSLMARHDVPAIIVKQVHDVLLDMPNNTAGQKVLAAMAFKPFETADNRTYEPVRSFIRKFNKEVRPIDTFEPNPQPGHTGRQD